MVSLNNHTSTSTYESKGKLLKIGRGHGKNLGRITTGCLTKKIETGTTNYSNFIKSNAQYKKPWTTKNIPKASLNS